jgi:hypothetical protein
VLSLATERQSAKRRIGLCAKRQGDIAPHDNTPFGMLRYRQDDKTTVRQRAVWRVSIATGRKVDIDIGCVVAIDNAKSEVYQISHHTDELHTIQWCHLKAHFINGTR